LKFINRIKSKIKKKTNFSHQQNQALKTKPSIHKSF